MTNGNKNGSNAIWPNSRDWAGPSGWRLAEYAFQSGFLFSLLAGRRSSARGSWHEHPLLGGPGRNGKTKSSPGIEADSRSVWSASGRGARNRASHNPQRQPSPQRGASWAGSPAGSTGLHPNKKYNAVLSRTQGEAK